MSTTPEDSKKSGYDPSMYTDQAKKERFLRIAEKRTNRLLNDMRLLGNTSNRHLYLYDAHDVEKIFSTIETRLMEVKTKFKVQKDGPEFRLR